MSQRQHGVKGAYVAGDWVDMEDLGEKFNVDKNKTSCKGDCEGCPRSRSRNDASRAGADGTPEYDVIVVGAGCVGGSIARELAKFELAVLVLEAADDVSQGATKGNSGIVHAGYDDKPGSVRAKFCWPGNQMFSKLDEELHFGYQKNGSLVVATNSDEVKVLHELKARGDKNGVKNLEIIQKEKLFELEPHLNPDCIAALRSPDAGNLIPYEFAVALMENAVDNGIELRIRRAVRGIKRVGDKWEVEARHWEPASYIKATSTPSIVAPAALMAASAVIAGLAGTSHPLTASFHVPAEIASVLESTIPVPAQAGALFIASAALAVAALLIFLASGSAKYNPKSAAPDSVGGGGRKIKVSEMLVGGSGCASAVDGETVGTERYRAKFIVNAAGGYSDKISAMIGDDSFKIKPRLGDYLLLNRDQGYLASHTIFPCPDPVLGKGVLVQTTLWGNLILGPTARDTYKKEMADMTDEEVQKYILSKCSKLVPSFDAKKVIHGFCGARAKNSTGDWVIGPSKVDKTFVQAAGIDSPGLAGSPAIALEIVKCLSDAGLPLTPDADFNPLRAPIITPKSGWRGIKAGPKGKVKDPKQNVVCKCEKVTEAEVVEALHRSLPIDSTQGIRKRTRAGMGHCQGEKENYDCECRVAEIIARENKIPVEAVGRRPWPATSTVPERWFSDTFRDKLAAMMR